MTILYFAWIRSRIGFGEEQVAPPSGIATLGQLLQWLRARSPGHAQAFTDQAQVFAAVNQDFAGWDHPVKAGDEVAFFPPVTGG